MSTKQSAPLIGRLAIQCKMITMEQLQEATREQGRDPERNLGSILIGLGYLDAAQVHKLKKLQRDLVIKHRAQQAAAGRTVPRPALPDARKPGPPKQRPARGAAEQPVPAQPQSEPPPLRRVEAEPIPAPAAEPSVASVEPSAPPPREPAPPATRAPQAGPPEPPIAAPEPAPAAQICEQGGSSLGLSITDPGPDDAERLHTILRDAVRSGASDVHLHSNAPQKLRLNGELEEISSTPMDAREVELLVSAGLTSAQRTELCHAGELDTCYDVAGVGRFRTNIYRQQRGFDAVYRAIPADPPTLDQLGLPNALAKHTNYHQGMVLITGPAGCGKSSTMAALVNLINEERDEHILTIEDPIEYVHPSKRCLVNQRHAGRHTSSFARALRGALREDPDVIVIGELRDLETISLAMTAAETGHFVLATLHTSNAVRTVSRMIGAFPSNQQGQVRTMLSESLRCVISQRLVVAADGSGRIPALEMLVINKAIGNLIRDEKTIQIRSAIQTGSAHGMCLLEQSLNELARGGQITRDEALRIAEDKKLITD